MPRLQAPNPYIGAIDFRNFARPRHPHVHGQLRLQDLHHLRDPTLSECCQAPQIRTSDPDGRSTQCERFEHIGTPAEAAIYQYGNFPAGRLDTPAGLLWWNQPGRAAALRGWIR